MQEKNCINFYLHSVIDDIRVNNCVKIKLLKCRKLITTDFNLPQSRSQSAKKLRNILLMVQEQLGWNPFLVNLNGNYLSLEEDVTRCFTGNYPMLFE